MLSKITHKKLFPGLLLLRGKKSESSLLCRLLADYDEIASPKTGIVGENLLIIPKQLLLVVVPEPFPCSVLRASENTSCFRGISFRYP